ncbi:MAG: NTP transferase domain-containing protein [Oligoflexia bacterium]|nr:NTP transferase domain-containing protein [Oligoflexia bacterium]
MKQDKALLKLGGVNLLQRQFQLLEKHLGKGNVFVSGERTEFPHVKDTFSGMGPLEGLMSVCRHLLNLGKLKTLLVVPVDMPFMTDSGLNRLINFSSHKAVTKFYGQQLPIVINDALLVLKIIEELKQSTDSVCESNCSFRSLFKKVQIEEIPAEPSRFFININTPEEWNAALP